MYQRESNPASESAAPQRWYGKYRGVVVSSSDLTKSGKLKISVPEILKDKEPWAAPCVPYAQAGHGMFFMPPDGTQVWVEFVGGDLSQPVWSGFEWGKGEAPAGDAKEMMISTPSGTVKFTPGNKNGDVVIETKKLSIVLRDDTVTLTASSKSTIKMQGTSTTINTDGLEVM